MAWFTKTKGTLEKGPARRGNNRVPDNLWIKCKHCAEILYQPELERNRNVCTKCGFHFYLPANKRIESLLDEGSVEPILGNLQSLDPLNFRDTQRYRDRLKSNKKKVGISDAFLAARGTCNGIGLLLGVFEFKFMGGSMGSVVGESVTRLFEAGIDESRPVVIVSASGGARMQEGIFSLFQMAKTSAARIRFREKVHKPFISILTDPTTGGVAASFAMLGDIVLAEPGALIGFAGPRVIEQTIRQKLPKGFQRSEFLLEHGMLDRIVKRSQMKETLANLLDLLV